MLTYLEKMNTAVFSVNLGVYTSKYQSAVSVVINRLLPVIQTAVAELMRFPFLQLRKEKKVNADRRGLLKFQVLPLWSHG